MQAIRIVFLISICLVITSCMPPLGPRIAKTELFDYNDAFAHSRAQSHLLNIVRLRYDHSPVQLAIASAASNKSLQESLTGTGSGTWGGQQIPFAQTVQGTAGGTAVLTYTDNPTITFNPIDGQQFQNEFLRALSLKNIALLLESQWSIARVFRLSLQQAGTAINASSAARPTSHHIPRYKLFDQMIYVLRRIQLDDGFVSYWGAADGRETLELHMYPHIKLSQKEKGILKKAGVTIKNHIIRFTNYPGPDDTFVVTRSILGSMNYLSKGVQVPQALYDKNLAVQTRYRNGKPFQWQKVLRGMSKIYSGPRKPDPEITDVAVQFHGYWYWVDERDQHTKQSMMLIQYLIGLIQTQSSGSSGSGGGAGIGGSPIVYSIATGAR